MSSHRSLLVLAGAVFVAAMAIACGKVAVTPTPANVQYSTPASPATPIRAATAIPGPSPTAQPLVEPTPTQVPAPTTPPISETLGFDEGIYRPNHDLVQWHQYPTYRDGKVSFSGVLLKDAVFSYPNSSPRLGAGVYPNFRGRLASDHKYLGSVVPPGSTLPLVGWPLYSFDILAESYRIDGPYFEVTFAFPQGLEYTPADYVITVYGFENQDRTPTIAVYPDSGQFTDLLGYARIRMAPDS